MVKQALLVLAVLVLVAGHTCAASKAVLYEYFISPT